MILSGLLFFGCCQKNKRVALPAFAALYFYLLFTSLSLPFFFLNIGVIFVMTSLLKLANHQLLAGASILVYSVIIDIICFYLFPLFATGNSLLAYITAGLLFNIRSAMPAVAAALAVSAGSAIIKYVKKRKSNGIIIVKNLRLENFSA